MPILPRLILVVLLGLVALGLGRAVAQEAAQPSVEMLIVEQPGCIYCARWHEEIGPAWGKTPLGQQLPLRSVQLSEVNLGRYTLERPVVFTPSFVLLRAGAEVGRLEGYVGSNFFWPMLEAMVDKAGLEPDG